MRRGNGRPASAPRGGEGDPDAPADPVFDVRPLRPDDELVDDWVTMATDDARMMIRIVAPCGSAWMSHRPSTRTTWPTSMSSRLSLLPLTKTSRLL